MTDKDKLIDILTNIFDNTKRIHGDSEAIDWIKVAIHKSAEYIIESKFVESKPQKTAEKIRQEIINKFKGNIVKHPNPINSNELKMLNLCIEYFAQQFQKPLPNEEDYCTCGNPSKEGNVHFEDDERLIYNCVDCGKRMKDC